MSDFNYRQLDEIIHSRIRLAVMAVVISVDEAEFTYLKEKVNTTDGNLSSHLKKLEEAGYIAVSKSFENRKPVSRYMLKQKGKQAFEIYVKRLENMLKS